MVGNVRVYDQLIYGFETKNIDIMSKVNRSTYQKAVEENKKLIANIKLLVEDGLPSAEKILCIAKWRKKFNKEKEFNSMMKQAARQYIKDHADELPDFLTKGVVNLFAIPAVVGQSEQLKCDCCDGTGMVEGEHYDDLQSCNTCLGKGTF